MPFRLLNLCQPFDQLLLLIGTTDSLLRMLRIVLKQKVLRNTVERISFNMEL